MPEVSLNIEGVRELQRNVDKLSRSFSKSTLRTALRNAAAPVRKEARSKAPKESGALRRAIKSRAKVTRSGFGFADVGVEKGDVFYGHFIEVGTSQQPARPFLRPALDDAERDGRVTDAFITALNKTIERQVGRIRGA